MATKKKNLSAFEAGDLGDMSDKHIGMVTSRWNQDITSALAEGCKKTLLDHGVQEENLFEIEVPGSFELPMGARLLAGSEKLDAVICLGCVIKGETKHDEYISNAVANGVMNLGLTSGIPVIFGVLTPNDMAQAKDRAGGRHGNKGIEAASTALQMIHLANHLKETKSSIGFDKFRR